MTTITQHKLLNYFIALVWLVNGFFCKVLNLVPRHQEIVATILGTSHARSVTVLIGLSEIGMAVWIISRLWPRFNVVSQIAIIATMNALEFVLAPDLLLWGKANALFAFLFIVLIFFNEFWLNKNPAQHA